MSAFSNGALKARIEGISGEEGQDIGLSGETGIGAVVVHDGLESGDTTDRLSRAWSIVVSLRRYWRSVGHGDVLYVVDIVVMDQTQIRRGGPFAGMGDGKTVGFDRRHAHEDTRGAKGDGGAGNANWGRM